MSTSDIQESVNKLIGMMDSEPMDEKTLGLCRTVLSDARQACEDAQRIKADAAKALEEGQAALWEAHFLVERRVREMRENWRWLALAWLLTVVSPWIF